MFRLEKDLNQILLRIEALCTQYGWNHYRLAKASGLPLASLNSMFSRNTFPTIPTLEKICTGFQLSLQDFFDYDTTIQPPKLNSELISLIERYKELTRADKKRLLSYLDGLQKKETPS
jgi:transcriptional regulator with XRE-family HTH domain